MAVLATWPHRWHAGSRMELFVIVRALAGMELILFVLAHRVLCFESVAETGLVTHPTFWLLLSSTCTVSRPPASRLGLCREPGGEPSQDT